MRWVMAAMMWAGCNGGAEDDPAIVAILDLTGDTTAGEAVFADTCGTSSCHDADGSGGGSGIDLREHVPHHSDYELVSFVLYGVDAMPPLDVSDQEAADVLAYLRSTFGEHE